MNLATATPREIDETIAELEGQLWGKREIIRKKLETVHHAVGDRKTYAGRHQVWRESDKHVLALLKERIQLPDNGQFLVVGGFEKIRQLPVAIEAAEKECERLEGEIRELDDEYSRRPWSRFFQLRATDGAKIHDTRWCQGLHRSNLGDLGWHPELSGLSVAEAVEQLGPVLCTKCFPKERPEWKQNPADLKPADPDACSGAEEDPVPDTRNRVKTWNSAYYEAKCTGCDEMKRLRSDSKIGKHKKPKGK